MDMMNFLDPRLKPEITADCPCSDDFEIENLLKPDDQKGFIAYQTIKPPINIDIQLIFAIRASIIKIWNHVGAQISTGFELQIRSANNEYITVFKKLKFDKQLTQLSVFSPQFYKEHYRNDKSCFSVYNRQNYLMANCKFLRLRILQTDKSVPCLKKIQIWGFPITAKETRIVDILLKNSNQLKNKSPEKQLNTKLETISNKLEIPEEFQDAITFELMTIPMTLPSGKNVDLTTLNTHNKNQEMWGRSCSDPFTGLRFNQYRKPVLNSSLKNRIDHFLLLNSNNPETFQIPRTVASYYDRKTTYEKQICLQCNNQPDFIYKLPCDHFYCRSCLTLTISNSYQCIDCSNICRASQVQKMHQ